MRKRILHRCEFNPYLDIDPVHARNWKRIWFSFFMIVTIREMTFKLSWGSSGSYSSLLLFDHTTTSPKGKFHNFHKNHHDKEMDMRHKIFVRNEKSSYLVYIFYLFAGQIFVEQFKVVYFKKQKFTSNVFVIKEYFLQLKKF